MSELNDADLQIRQVALPEKKESRPKRKFRNFPVGIVAEPSPALRALAPGAVQEADMILQPIKPGPITASNGGGAIGTAIPVQVLFWGSAWNLPATIPSASTILSSVQNILIGPWMSGLRQYGVRRCSFGGSLVVNSPDPPATYEDSDIKNLTWDLIDDNKFPEPDEPGGRNLYLIFMPPGTTYGPGDRGAHTVAKDIDLPADVDNAWVGFITWQPLKDILSTFTHELAEMCTDPEGDAWTVAGPNFTDRENEIGDVCNAVDKPLNGVNVESYWSAADNACLIPTAYSVRRMLLWSGHKLDGKGLRSLQSPIGSLNQLITNL
jgi:hypothetical protein